MWRKNIYRNNKVLLANFMKIDKASHEKNGEAGPQCVRTKNIQKYCLRPEDIKRFPRLVRGILPSIFIK